MFDVTTEINNIMGKRYTDRRMNGYTTAASCLMVIQSLLKCLFLVELMLNSIRLLQECSSLSSCIDMYNNGSSSSRSNVNTSKFVLGFEFEYYLNHVLLLSSRAPLAATAGRTNVVMSNNFSTKSISKTVGI